MYRRAILLALLCTACSETSELDGGTLPPKDATVDDAGSVADASVRADAGTVDAGDTADAGVPADAGVSADAGTIADAGMTADAGTVADGGGAADAGTCNYIDLDVCIVDCMGYEYARRFVDTNSACPDFYRLNGQDYPTIQAAITAQNCNQTCIYKASTSVSFIDHCNRRNGYIIFRARDAACPDLYEFSNGLFLSVADWEAVTPCP